MSNSGGERTPPSIELTTGHADQRKFRRGRMVVESNEPNRTVHAAAADRILFVFPFTPPPRRWIFEAFAARLYDRTGQQGEGAA